jgi:hypothetical protein
MEAMCHSVSEAVAELGRGKLLSTKFRLLDILAKAIGDLFAPDEFMTERVKELQRQPDEEAEVLQARLTSLADEWLAAGVLFAANLEKSQRIRGRHRNCPMRNVQNSKKY